jgi:hypothetical protein
MAGVARQFCSRIGATKGTPRQATCQDTICSSGMLMEEDSILGSVASGPDYA